MTQPIEIPGPDGGTAAYGERRPDISRAGLLGTVAIVAGTAVLGVAAGFVWGALAPRAVLVISAPGQASLVNVETTAYIAADGVFTLVTLAGGIISGLAGYLLGVRRHGPVAMAGVLAGAVAAAFIARWVGEQTGLATFHHLLASLPTGARLVDSLTLRAASALAFWPLAAGLVAGGLEMLAQRGVRRVR